MSYVYMKISYKFHRIPGTSSCVITKVHDLLGQPLIILIHIEPIHVTSEALFTILAEIFRLVHVV